MLTEIYYIKQARHGPKQNERMIGAAIMLFNSCNLPNSALHMYLLLAAIILYDDLVLACLFALTLQLFLQF